MFEDYPVKYLADSEIESVADKVRQRLFGAALPGTELHRGLEHFEAQNGVVLQIIARPDEELGDYEAYVSANKKRIFCKKSVYQNYVRGEVVASGIIAHELGHYVLHPAKELRFLATGGNKVLSFIPPNESAERQAWLFADHLQMPSWSLLQVEAVSELASLCNVTVERGLRRWKNRPNIIAATPQPLTDVDRAWAKALHIRGEDPGVYRESMGYRIARREYRQMTQCGWSLRVGSARPWLLQEAEHWR